VAVRVGNLVLIRYAKKLPSSPSPPPGIDRLDAWLDDYGRLFDGLHEHVSLVGSAGSLLADPDFSRQPNDVDIEIPLASLERVIEHLGPTDYRLGAQLARFKFNPLSGNGDAGYLGVYRILSPRSRSRIPYRPKLFHINGRLLRQGPLDVADIFLLCRAAQGFLTTDGKDSKFTPHWEQIEHRTRSGYRISTASQDFLRSVHDLHAEEQRRKSDRSRRAATPAAANGETPLP
jgi:hypothetical protein